MPGQTLCMGTLMRVPAPPQITRASAIGLLVVLVATAPACVTGARSSGSAVQLVPSEHSPAAPSGSDWEAVEAIVPGTEIEAHLAEPPAVLDDRVITGEFRSATPDALMLTFTTRQKQQTRTLERQAIQRVRSPRRFWKRPLGWAAFGGFGLASMAYLNANQETTPGNVGSLWGLSLLGALPFFAISAMGTVYEVPDDALIDASGLISDIAVNVADGTILRPGQEVLITVSHGLWARRFRDTPVGLTVCVSTQRARCDGRSARNEGLAQDLSNPVISRLRLSSRFHPWPDQFLYVHVVVRKGRSWWPADDPRVPQRGDPGLLAVETVARLVGASQQPAASLSLPTCGRAVGAAGVERHPAFC